MADERILLDTRRFRVVEVAEPDSSGQPRTREIIRHPGAVAIVPMVDPDHVCLIQNYRVSVGRTLIELPAGTLDEGEDPRTAAERELIEETGYRAEHWRRLGAFFPSPGFLDERMHVYVATGLRPGEADREPGEMITNLVVPWREALAMARDGRIEDAKSIVGILLYFLL